MSQGLCRNTPGVINNTQPIGTIHSTMASIAPNIKSAEQAKSHLYSTGWALPGEEISLETLARALFSIVANHSKLPAAVSSVILAAAYLITDKIEAGIKLNITNAITEHVLESLTPITADIQTKLQDHLKAIAESDKTHTELTEKLRETQEKLEETTEKVASNAKSYSQAVTSTLPPSHPNPLPTNPGLTYSQIQIQNREEIKRHQVLINFDKDADKDLDILDEHTLSRKSLDSLNTTWAAATDPKPPLPKLKAATLLRNGGLLLELDKSEGAEWLKEDLPRRSFLANLGSGANLKDRSYQVIVQFVPVQFDPTVPEQLRNYEAFNGLEPNSVLKADWIKPPKDRKPNQRVATLRVFHKNAASANKILSEGASILNKRVIPKKTEERTHPVSAVPTFWTRAPNVQC